MGHFFIKNGSVMQITEYRELDRGFIRPVSAKCLYGKMEEVPTQLISGGSYGTDYQVTPDGESAIMMACNRDISPFMNHRESLHQRFLQGLESLALMLNATYMRFHDDGTFEVHRSEMAITNRGIDHLVHQHQKSIGPLVGKWTSNVGWEIQDD